MCSVRERGDGAAAVSGWSRGRRGRDTGRLHPNEGAFLPTESACVSPADGLLSAESWGVGVESVPCARGGPFFIPHFTSPCLPSAVGFVTLCFVCCCFVPPSMYLTFVDLFSYKNNIIFCKEEEGVIFLCKNCFVFSEEQVGRLVVTGVEC